MNEFSPKTPFNGPPARSLPRLTIRLLSIDVYNHSPTPTLDMCYSQLLRQELTCVPIYRIFGTTVDGQHCCVHVHGAFPYLLVRLPNDAGDAGDGGEKSYAESLALSLNAAMGVDDANQQQQQQQQQQPPPPARRRRSQFVAAAQLLYNLREFYGYDGGDDVDCCIFLKLMFVMEADVKRAAHLLRQSTVMQRRFEVFETHVSPAIRFMIDYSLFGCSLVHFGTSNSKLSSSTAAAAAATSSSSLSSSLQPQSSSPSPILLIRRESTLTKLTSSSSSSSSSSIKRSRLERLCACRLRRLAACRCEALDESTLTTLFASSPLARVTSCELEFDCTTSTLLNEEEQLLNDMNNSQSPSMVPQLAMLWAAERRRRAAAEKCATPPSAATDIRSNTSISPFEVDSNESKQLHQRLEAIVVKEMERQRRRSLLQSSSTPSSRRSSSTSRTSMTTTENRLPMSQLLSSTYKTPIIYNNERLTQLSRRTPPLTADVYAALDYMGDLHNWWDGGEGRDGNDNDDNDNNNNNNNDDDDDDDDDDDGEGDNELQSIGVAQTLLFESGEDNDDNDVDEDEDKNDDDDEISIENEDFGLLGAREQVNVYSASSPLRKHRSIDYDDNECSENNRRHSLIMNTVIRTLFPRLSTTNAATSSSMMPPLDLQWKSSQQRAPTPPSSSAVIQSIPCTQLHLYQAPFTRSKLEDLPKFIQSTTTWNLNNSSSSSSSTNLLTPALRPPPVHLVLSNVLNQQQHKQSFNVVDNTSSMLFQVPAIERRLKRHWEAATTTTTTTMTTDEQPTNENIDDDDLTSSAPIEITDGYTDFAYPSTINDALSCTNLCILCLSVLCQTRRGKAADPQHDAIVCVSWRLHDEHALFKQGSSMYEDAHGFIVQRKVLSRKEMCIDSRRTHLIQCIDEEALLRATAELVRSCDPDFVVGWDVQRGGVGYLLERAAAAFPWLDYANALARTPSATNTFDEESDSWGYAEASGIHLAGRVVVNVWRSVARAELSLRSYSLHSVARAVLHRSIPEVSVDQRSEWLQSSLHKRLAVADVQRESSVTMAVLAALGGVSRCAEFAQLFGTTFENVLTRGSQHRVECMMLRLTKKLNFACYAPAPDDVASQRAPQWIALVAEPQSALYTAPVCVLDFASLYPSMMIAHNLCYSTCIGMLSAYEELQMMKELKIDEEEEEEGEEEEEEEEVEAAHKLGARCNARLVPLSTLVRLAKSKAIFIAPNGALFVRRKERVGVLPRMLSEVLEARAMVKRSMAEATSDAERRALDARQLGLKLLANVTYGFTSASFSGRMPMVELADAIVACGRATLERGMQLVLDEQARMDEAVEIVYADTDSMFVHLPGRTRGEAHAVGRRLAALVTAANTPPVSLKFEKVYHPCLLQTKKRYVGYSYESEEQLVPKFDAKGIETVRRDGCGALSAAVRDVVCALFDSGGDLQHVKQVVRQHIRRIYDGKVPLNELTFAKEIRRHYRAQLPAAAIVAARTRAADARAAPVAKQRVRYIVIAGAPNTPLKDLVQSPPIDLSIHSPPLHSDYYVSLIVKALNRILCLVGVNDVYDWISNMIKRARHALVRRVTGPLDSFWQRSQCIACRKSVVGRHHGGAAPSPIVTDVDAPINSRRLSLCTDCQSNLSALFERAHAQRRALERRLSLASAACAACTHSLTAINELAHACSAYDCPVRHYRSTARQQELIDIENLLLLISRARRRNVNIL